MSTTTTAPPFLLDKRGTSRALDAFVVAAAFDKAGHTAFALGDGTLRLVPFDTREEWREVVAHDGAVLSLAAAPGGGFVTGGDDGRVKRIDAAGSVTQLASYGSKWVEHVAAHEEAGLIGCGVGRVLHLLDAKGNARKTLEHPSSVTGIAFDGRGKKVGASHYNGASLWFVASKSDNPRKLEWKGSHIGIAISPDGDAIVTSMQENSLHGWRLSDSQHMRMSGYPAKTQALSFTRNGKWLASSGADSVVVWPFFGGGPMGKPPVELAGGDGQMCTMVACHPQQEICAAGFADGLVVLADINAARILPIAPPANGPISALAWSTDGARLAFGTETGFAALVDLTG